jgi:hypothetical protein
MTALGEWFCNRCRSILLVEYRRSADALGLYRIAFAGYCLFIAGLPTISWIAGAPQAFFDPPPGLPRLLSGFPPPWVLSTLDAVLVLLFVALLIGWYTRGVSLGVSSLLLVENCFQYSLGKIDHDILFVLAPTVFAGVWGRSFSLDARGRSEPAPRDGVSRLAILACLIAFGFFTSGLPKLIRWIDFDLGTHGVKRWVLSAVHQGRTELLVPFFASLETPWLWELLDAAAVAFELGFVVALLVGPRLFGLWAVLAVAFHFTNHLILNIAFLLYLPLYLAFADWEAAARGVHAAAARFAPGVAARVALAAAAAGAAVTAARWWMARPGGAAVELQLGAPLGAWRPTAVMVAALGTAMALGARSLLVRGRAESRRSEQAP